MLGNYWLSRLFLLSYISNIVNGLFFGSLGGGGCGCGCCMPSCCPAITIPSISLGCAGGGIGMGGCSQQSQASPCSSNSGFPSFGGQSFGGGCSQSSRGFQQMGGQIPLPSGYASSPVLPTFSPQLPPVPVYSVAPTENSSGGNSPSYPPPPPPSASSYNENIDLSDNVEKPKIATNEITGIDTLTDKTVKSTGLPGEDLYEEKVPNIEDYGDVSSNRSGKGGNKKNDLLTDDFTDDSFKSKVSGIPNDLMNLGMGVAADQDTTGDPKCSSETLRIIMQENIVSSPTISKQLIFSAGRLAFGQTIDVICSRNKFSYTVVSSKIFCEASRGRITCFSFLQP